MTGDEHDRLVRRVLWRLPTGLYVVGSKSGERRNLMTANLAVQISTEPRVVGVSIERAARTHELIEEGGAFSLCLLEREDRAIVRRFVKPVEEGSDGTLNGFAVHTAVTGAPILEVALGYLDCTVVGRLDFASHTFFAGEVVDAAFQEGALDGGDPEEVPVLRMEDTRMHYGG